MAGVEVDWVYNQTCIDPPELVYHLRDQHPDVRWRKAKTPFFKEVARQGLPTRRIRWCCRLYKERETDAAFMLFGLRKAEGSNRSSRIKVFQPWGEPYGRFALNPLAYWTDEDVWRFIGRENIQYCKLYDEGWKRLGCIGCPMGRKQRIKQFERWPGYGKLWRRAAARYWETHQHTKTCAKYDTPEAFFDWWLSDKASTEDDDCQMGLF